MDDLGDIHDMMEAIAKIPPSEESVCLVCLESYKNDNGVSFCCDDCGRCGFCPECAKPENHDCE